MAKQYLIPGIGYENAVADREYLIPGSVYMNDVTEAAPPAGGVMYDTRGTLRGMLRGELRGEMKMVR